MKVTANKTDLLKELQKALPFVERKTIIPILANFLFNATADALTVTATDLDCSLLITIPAHVKKTGQCAIPARKLAKCIKTLKTIENDTITIELKENNWIFVSCGPLNAKMVGMDAKNFPVIQSFPAETIATVPGDVLDGLVARTTYAISKEESRHTLKAALLVIRPQDVRMVTTDGHRLANVARAGSYGTKETRTLVSKDAMGHLRTLTNTSDVEIAKNEKDIFFRSDNWTMVSRVVIGQFPNYEAVMPKDNNQSAILRGTELKATLARIAQFADDRTQGVKFELIASEGLKLSAASTEAGEASETIPTPYNGDNVLIGFNADYVQDILATLDKTGDVELKLRDSHSSALFVPVADGEYQSQNVLMPMRI